MKTTVKIRVDDQVYNYLKEKNASIEKIVQIFVNQLNYYLNEKLSIYEYLRGIKDSEVFYAIADELQRIEEEIEKKEEMEKYNEENNSTDQRAHMENL